jgi:hypothetical protein
MTEATLAVLIFGPLVITYFLKANAALAFLALCAGFVLNTSVIGNLKQLLSQMNLSLTNETLGLALLLVPLILTLLLTRRHSHHKSLLFFCQLLAALAAGGLLALSAGPLLAGSANFNFTNTSFWDNLTKIQAGVIGIGAAISLILIWLSNFKHPKH